MAGACKVLVLVCLLHAVSCYKPGPKVTPFKHEEGSHPDHKIPSLGEKQDRFVEYDTDGTLKLTKVDLPLKKVHKLLLEIKACKNAYLVLSQESTIQNRGNYFILMLSTGRNQRMNGIKDGCFTCNTFNAHTIKTTVRCDKFVPFFIKWDGDGSIQVGEGLDETVDTNIFLQYKSNNSFPINFLNIISQQVNASWRFRTEPAETPEPDSRKPSGSSIEDVKESARTPEPDSRTPPGSSIGDENGCPVSRGYHQLLDQQMCLRISNWSDLRNWDEARRACQEDKGDLISFRNEAEEKKVLEYLNGLGNQTNSLVHTRMSLWVGMDKQETGLWTWVSGSKFKGEWGKSYPRDNWQLQCVSLLADGLSNSMCASKRRFICQVDVSKLAVKKQ